tara:strand:- start:470 stop:640 length:171 start_codon:yes stop_codon:yes gene_type:complete
MNTLTVKLTEEEIHEIKNALTGYLRDEFEGFIKMIDDAKQKEQDKIYGKSCKNCDV